MAEKKLINTFEAISKFDNFSKYNCILDQEFKDKSLKSFIISLKHYKTKDKESFIEEFYKKYPYQFEEKAIIEDDEEIFKNIAGSKNKIKPEKENNDDNQIKLIVRKKKIKENEIPDSLRYNPNYNSIFKKIPGFKMGYGKKEISKNSISKKNKKKDFKNNNNSKSDKIAIDDKNKHEIENNLFKTNIKINNTNDKENNGSKKDIFLNLPPISFRNINNNLKNSNDINKKYNTIEVKNNIGNKISRLMKYHQKNFNSDLENNKNKPVSTYNRHVLDNKVIDFRKMSSRNDKCLINAYSLDVPSFEKYSPKYSFVENNVKNIIFSPFGLKKINKKFLFKKLICSYNVPTEYQYIDNEKLLNDKDLIKKKLILNYNNYS